jgi:hypothetical protein
LLSATFCNNDIKPQDDFQHHNSITKILFWFIFYVKNKKIW